MEAAIALKISKSQVEKMSRDERSTPSGIIIEMRELIRRQQDAADAFLDQIDALSDGENGPPSDIELGYPADDFEAQQLGMPSVRAWSVVAGRIIAETEIPVRLVPRGATPASAKAADENDQAIS